MTETIPSDVKAISFKFDEEFSTNTIYVKEYSPTSYDEAKPLGRTLFVTRIPLYLNENDVKKLFSEFGPIVSVNLHRKKPLENEDENMDNEMIEFQSAYVVYKTRASLFKVMNAKVLKTLADEKYSPIKGIVEEFYSLGPLETMKAYQMYNEQEKEEELNDKNGEDDDGWTVVTTKGRKPGIASKLSEKLSRKEKNKQNKNFYTFQMKESKMRNLAALMEGYEEAKKRVSKIKQNRSFKPFQ